MNKISKLLALLTVASYLPISAQVTTPPVSVPPPVVATVTTVKTPVQPPVQDSSGSVFVITNVNVWDGLSDSLLRNYQVVVSGNHISQVGSGITLPPRAKIIDGKGYTLIPGLSDANLHLMSERPVNKDGDDVHWAYAAVQAADMAEDLLMEGFTTIRDMGGPVFGIKQAIDEGMIPGPRIYPSGASIRQAGSQGNIPNSNAANPYRTGEHPDISRVMGWSYMVDGRPEVLNAVRENLRNGATQIEIVAAGDFTAASVPLHTVLFAKDELEAGVQAAEDWGTYVSVHACNAKTIRRALEAGVKSIGQGQMIDDSTMLLLKAKGAYLVPQSYWIAPAISSSNNPQKFQQIQTSIAHEMELAKKHNARLAFGSNVSGNPDAAPDALKEFTTRTQWFTPLEVLKQATVQNAGLFALSGNLNPYPYGDLGIIRPGAYADLLIYDGNPLQDIKVIVDFKNHLKFIMKDGIIYKNEL